MSHPTYLYLDACSKATGLLIVGDMVRPAQPFEYPIDRLRATLYDEELKAYDELILTDDIIPTNDMDWCVIDWLRFKGAEYKKLKMFTVTRRNETVLSGGAVLPVMLRTKATVPEVVRQWLPNTVAWCHPSLVGFVPSR